MARQLTVFVGVVGSWWSFVSVITSSTSAAASELVAVSGDEHHERVHGRRGVQYDAGRLCIRSITKCRQHRHAPNGIDLVSSHASPRRALLFCCHSVLSSPIITFLRLTTTTLLSSSWQRCVRRRRRLCTSHTDMNLLSLMTKHMAQQWLGISWRMTITFIAS